MRSSPGCVGFAETLAVSRRLRPTSRSAQPLTGTTHMDTIYDILIGAAALGVFLWLLVPSSSSNPSAADGELIDPSDSHQIGLLIGLAGGGIADAAVARFALERFEQIHGRKATTRDVGLVVGLMRGGDDVT